MADGREERAEEEARREWDRKSRRDADDEREYDGPEGDRERGGS